MKPYATAWGVSRQSPRAPTVLPEPVVGSYGSIYLPIAIRFPAPETAEVWSRGGARAMGANTAVFETKSRAAVREVATHDLGVSCVRQELSTELLMRIYICSG